MDLQLNQGYDAIMVVDRLPVKEGSCHTDHIHVMASGVAQLFRDHIWKLHDLPEEVISDLGTQFISKLHM